MGLHLLERFRISDFFTKRDFVPGDPGLDQLKQDRGVVAVLESSVRNNLLEYGFQRPCRRKLGKPAQPFEQRTALKPRRSPFCGSRLRLLLGNGLANRD